MSIVKRIKNTDFLFAFALLLGLLIHIYFVFAAPFFDDESFYASIPFRLVNGDSLIQHEWHLTQFSSLFSTLPVYLWTALKGSADGIFVFLRFTYLIIHTIIAVIIYIFFRKHEKWAVIASIMFYAQASYRTLAISYQSMFVMFLLLLSLCLVSIYQKKSVHLYLFAGICYGCCCVCNPLFCFAFVLYLLVCALWQNQERIKEKIIEIKISSTLKKGKKLTKKEKKEQKQQLLDAFPDVESYNCFFTKDAILRFSCGLLIAVVIAVVFFFATGGTIGSIIENIDNLLGSSEYDIASSSVFSKFFETIVYLMKASLGMGWVLPAIFIVMLFDKNRKSNSHRFAYLSVAVIWTIIFIIGTMVVYKDMSLYAVSLPFCLMSTICYFLTKKKNKPLFYCMYVPCLIGAFFQYLAANTHLAVIGVVLAVSNIAGVFFAMDLWNEMKSVQKNNSEPTNKKVIIGHCHLMIIAGLCLQMLILGLYYQSGRIYTKNDQKVTVGPYAGVYMTDEDYDQYNKEISDMDSIKALTRENAPVLLLSYNNWMYLYLDRPIATYTTWYMGSVNTELMLNYYKENPQKIPKYIYIESSTPVAARIQNLSEMFEFTKEELPNGVLLTVQKCKF